MFETITNCAQLSVGETYYVYVASDTDKLGSHLSTIDAELLHVSNSIFTFFQPKLMGKIKKRPEMIRNMFGSVKMNGNSMEFSWKHK